MSGASGSVSAAPSPLTTPQKSAPKRSAAALRVPTPKRTGNPQIDDTNDAKRQMLQDLIDHCIQDDDHIIPLHATLGKRLRTSKTAGTEGFFPDLTNIYKAGSDFLLDFLEGRGAETQKLITAHSKDPEALKFLVHLETQIPFGLKPSEALFERAVLLKVMKHYGNEYGNRLQKFITDGGFDSPDGRAKFEKGCYRAVFDAKGVMIEIVHINGDKEKITDGMVDTSYGLRENYSDWNAYFEKKPYAKVKCSKLFEKNKTGPFRTLALKIKNADDPKFMAVVTNMQKDIHEKKRIVIGQENASSAATRESLKRMEQKAKDEKTAKAREKAREILQKKEKRTTVTFK